MNLELRAHPGQARGAQNQALYYENGTHVPIIKDQKSIYLDGVMCGYVKLDGAWLHTIQYFDQPVIDAIVKFASDELGTEIGKVMQAVPPQTYLMPAEDEGEEE